MDEGCPLTEKEQGHLDDCVSEFNLGRYWHAHEGWEEMWKSLKAREVNFKFILGIQGLIQVTALMFQYERQNLSQGSYVLLLGLLVLVHSICHS